tara:strand:+ start:78 stop:278 length:201 start_codon:yes stop_codon:yes gene_type:complete
MLKKKQHPKSQRLYMKKRDQIVKLQHKTGETVTAKVVQNDSKAGYLAELPNGDWMWFPPDEWKEVK